MSESNGHKDLALVDIHQENGWFPKSFASSLDQLADRVRTDFWDEGLGIVPDFFKQGSPNAPADLSIVVIGLDEKQNIMGDFIGQSDSYNGFNFTYGTKISVAAEWRGNGQLKNILDRVLQRSLAEGKPVIVRTSRENPHQKYSQYDDVYANLGKFHVHGFGFRYRDLPLKPGIQREGAERFKGAVNTFYELAPYVAAKPQTAIPMDQQAANAPSAEIRNEYLKIHPFAMRALGYLKQ